MTLPETDSPQYEPPQVVIVLTAAELAREIHYAGVGSGVDEG
jgi:hypothetical protein